MTNKPLVTKTYKRLYGNYKGKIRTIGGVTLFPIYACKNKPPMNFTQEICNYTKVGRDLIHKNLKNSEQLIARYLVIGNEYMSAELFDNSVSLIAGQNGKCYITECNLRIGHMECHHKQPKGMGETDEYKNLAWLSYEAHKLVHCTEQNTINKYLSEVTLNDKGLKRLNTLRKQVGNSVI